MPLIVATAATLVVSAVTPAPAEASGFGTGLAGGLIAGALIGGIASSTYGYGPGYGYSGGGYAPVYYGDMPRPTMAGAHSTMATETAIGGCIQPTLTMSGSTTMRVGAEAGVASISDRDLFPNWISWTATIPLGESERSGIKRSQTDRRFGKVTVAGLMDTKYGCFMEREVGHAETKVQSGIKIEAVGLVREAGYRRRPLHGSTGVNRKPVPGEIASHIHPNSAREPNGRRVLQRRQAPVHNKPAGAKQDAPARSQAMLRR
ncbi:MAG TPA: hypothetical protein VIL63_04105 [Terriglobales bacterium]